MSEMLYGILGLAGSLLEGLTGSTPKTSTLSGAGLPPPVHMDRAVISGTPQPTLIARHFVPNWSIRTKEDGDFITGQGVNLIPCVLQVEAIEGRREKAVYSIESIDWIFGRADLLKDGRKHHVILGYASDSYQKFLFTTRLASPLAEAA